MSVLKTISALGLTMIATAALAEDCAITVNSNDAMRFDVAEIQVSSSCTDFTVNLNHTGSLPKTSMGHNWVLTKEADARPVAQDGMQGGIEGSYVKPGDERVIAYTDIIGGGESTSVTFSVSKLTAGEKYKFFCSFPGHIGLMIGDLTLN